MISEEDIFSRSRLLLGEDVMRRMREVRVILFGVGGVGSWCAETLVRTGIRHLTIVDSDCVSASNINRQLMATTHTVGEVKVDVLKARLLSINPECDIDARREIFCEETAADFALESYDFIIDCIDSLKDKALLIDMATHTRATFYSSMGAALKLDPTRIRVAEFRNVTGCPLARALRQRFKKRGVFPRRKFTCIYSEELLKNRALPPDSPLLPKEETSFHKATINGSLMHITAIFGITIAGLLIEKLANE